MKKEKVSGEPVSLFTGQGFNIYMEVTNEQQELQFPDKYSSVHHVTELSRKVLFSLFNLVGANLKRTIIQRK